MATTTSPPQPTSSASSPLVQTTTATLGTSSPVAAATVPAGELTENIQYMKLLHELKAEFPAVPDELVKSCITQVRQ